MKKSFTYLFIVVAVITCSAQKNLDSILANAADSYSIHNHDSVFYSLDSTTGVYNVNSGDNYYLPDEYKTLPPKKVTLHKIDRDKWKKAKSGLRYDQEKKDDENSNFRFDLPQTTLFTGEAIKYIFMSIAIILLGVLLFFIFKNYILNKNVKKDQTVVSVDDIEDINAVEESELERLLREALEKKAYNEAIRVYYTFALKAVSGKGLIRWKKDKTNREYVYEMKGNEHHALFNEVTLVFEYVWYGERSIGELEYNLLVPKFKLFTENIKAVE